MTSEVHSKGAAPQGKMAPKATSAAGSRRQNNKKRGTPAASRRRQQVWCPVGLQRDKEEYKPWQQVSLAALRLFKDGKSPRSSLLAGKEPELTKTPVPSESPPKHSDLQVESCKDRPLKDVQVPATRPVKVDPNRFWERHSSTSCQ